MQRVVVVGASQGGVQALRTLIGGLPMGFPAPVLVVLHVGAGPSALPALLNGRAGLRASHARNGVALEPGCVLVAPPDRHLVILDGHVVLTGGPKENWARPAIDPLFRSAAETFGPGAIGVLLTGQLNDGVSGLWEIKRRGGLAIVQDPDEAEAPSMPQGAVDNVDIDFCLPLGQIAARLARLATDHGPRTGTGGHSMDDSLAPLARPTAQTCPECGGAMREETRGGLTRFRCHIGHVMTAEVMAAAQMDKLECDLARVLRTLNERVALCADLADRCAAKGDLARSEDWRQAADQAARREQAVRELCQASWQRPETAQVEEAHALTPNTESRRASHR
jgi:two-component system chemotaxis response regulator CheB